MIKSKTAKMGCLAQVILIGIYGVICVLLANWSGSNIEWIIEKFFGKITEIPFLISFIFNIVLNGFALTFNIVVYVMQLVM